MKTEDNLGVVGRYLYADYTPFEENKNFIEMLREFVTVSERLLTTKREIENSSAALAGADALYNDLALQFRNFSSTVQNTMTLYDDKFNEMLRAGGQTEGSKLFQDSKAILVKLLEDT